MRAKYNTPWGLITIHDNYLTVESVEGLTFKEQAVVKSNPIYHMLKEYHDKET